MLIACCVMSLEHCALSFCGLLVLSSSGIICSISLYWILLIGGVVFGTLSEVDCCVVIIIGLLWRVLRVCVMLDCLRVFGSVGVGADGDCSVGRVDGVVEILNISANSFNAFVCRELILNGLFDCGFLMQKLDH